MDCDKFKSAKTFFKTLVWHCKLGIIFDEAAFKRFTSNELKQNLCERNCGDVKKTNYGKSPISSVEPLTVNEYHVKEWSINTINSS
ncbi:hypothetical protein BpHYR1_009605 [Brachionus plicatilis]|uniref:Uncharacterized protein n=1 Tax=Brachionus plicatilis TaxID=10195 RepID=A0A3M7T5S1_BRAPC|nr:hypothetical protein BpHYR1_009605 [Brachionus plicatilis]